MTGWLIAALAMTVGLQGQGVMTKHATGNFEVKMTPEAQDVPADGVPTARMTLHKRFSGPLDGVATGTMLSAGTPAAGHAAAYVAIDQFAGTLDGRKGGFLLLHRGTMSKTGASELTVVVAPDSGTGALEGILGTLTIKVEGGKHLYDFTYTLPAGDGAGR